MASVCFYFQVHQPFRLRRYTVFDAAATHAQAARYFDDEANARVCRKIAEKCYRPANRLMLDLIARHRGRFRISYSITGVALDQFARWSPEVIETFRDLARTGCVEFLSETFHHSLASVVSPAEFRAQVAMHRDRLRDLLGAPAPRVFRNTELIYDNTLARMAAETGCSAVLAEGADRVLDGRSPNYVYRPPAARRPTLLLKNYGLSDDIAFRFSDRGWAGWPLTPAKFAGSVGRSSGPLVNLFMDYETLGEHQWAETGIFGFFAELPDALLASGHDFVTAGEAASRYGPVGELDVQRATSWADSERDTSAWLGNAMQTNALYALYELERPVKACGDPHLLEDWRRLTTSDHLYYMSTKTLADGDVHAYFSPYDSPYDAYINFMNVLDHLRRRVGGS
jgi:alpha-amylase